ncbi:MAG: dephospho-CoA kinase [Eubacteriales bacterium]|nr:dephospho-CoA kinase [Eubacteriales bacterium]
MKVIGVTGGIGSGKSTVSRIIYHLGARIIDADLAARAAVKKGSAALKELVDEFGDEILTQNGALNRRKLAKIAFSSDENRLKLNSITHKYIAAEIRRKLDRFKTRDDVEFVVIDVALPTEEGFLDLCDEVWTVVADKEVRISRVMKRSSMTREEILDRMKWQPDDDEYIKKADAVIENNSTAELLEKTIAKLFMQRKQAKENRRPYK